MKWDRLDVRIIGPNKSQLLSYISWFFIICTFLRVPSEAPNLWQGMVNMVLDADAGHDVYLSTMENSQSNLGDGRISNIFAIFSNLLFDFGVLLLFYNLQKNNYNKLTAIGLGISCLISTILPITISQRGPVLEHVLVIIIVYIAFSKNLSDKINNLIKKIFLVLISIISIPLFVITVSRFNDRGVLGSLFNYFGQQNLYFNMYAFDNNGIRYGDRVFPIFKRFLGFDNVPSNFWERRFKYPKLNINDEVFIGYVGDFLLDFGPIIPVVIFIIYSFITSNQLKIRHGRIHLFQLLPLMFLMHMVVYGSLFLFPFADAGNYTIIVYILMYCLFKSLNI